MIPVTLITGFLGSGKTTLLNCILKQNHGRKIAVIENEFGEKNIDYEFVLHEKEQIFQMTNGCICCNVREDLIKTMHSILEFADKFDSVIIETTGVADPSPVLHTLKQDQVLAEKFQIDSIVCLIDSKNFLKQLERSPEVKKQVTSADLALVNKTDLVDESEVQKIESKLIELNPELELIRTKNSHVELDQVFLRGLFKTKESVPKFIAKAKKINLANAPRATHESGIESRFFEFKGEIHPQYFGVWIDLLFFQFADQLYRMKGIIRFKNEPKRIFFQAVHDYLELAPGEPWRDDEEMLNQIVVIGKDLDFNVIEAGFESCVK